LVPVRSDVVDYYPEDWAKKPVNLLSNGPFVVKQMEYNKITSIERSTYYLLPGKKGENIFKYVTPYRLSLDFTRNINQVADAYLNATDTKDMVFFLGSVPVAKYEELKNKAVLKDMLSTYSYHFNVDNPLFAKAEVRKALSIALDRNKIAELAGLGVKPATGIVPTGIIDVKSTGDDFRKVGGDLIPVGGDLAEAKRLLQEAGVTGGSFTLKVKSSERGDNAEEEVAKYAADVWKQLGFNVTVVARRGVDYINDILWIDEKLTGAFHCDKESFIAISKFMLRNLERSGLFVTMVLATFASSRYNTDSKIIEITEKSSDILFKRLRKGDAMCRWNSHQLLIMFANLSQDDAEIALKRMKNMLKKDILKEDFDMDYEIVPLAHSFT